MNEDRVRYRLKVVPPNRPSDYEYFWYESPAEAVEAMGICGLDGLQTELRKVEYVYDKSGREWIRTTPYPHEGSEGDNKWLNQDMTPLMM